MKQKGLTPLQGRRIVLTRDKDGTSRVSARLGELGADVMEIPLLEVTAELDGNRAVEVF